MPSDTLSLTVGTGLGVSVFAGIISGVCFVIGYRSRINNQRNRKWHCSVCGEYLRSTEFTLKASGFVLCNRCNTKVCKSSCSLKTENAAWICRTCSENKDSWINGAFKVVEPFTKALRERMSFIDIHSNESKELDGNLEAANREKEQVRDFIERLVNNLLGDNVDDASVNKIYDDTNYLPIIGDSPGSAHSALKHIIQKIIREANDLPKLKGEGTTNVLDQADRTYEDLLSTAILNKIISNSQHNLGASCSSRANSVCSHRSSSSRRRLNKEYFFSDETLDNKWRNLETDTASLSSLEEWVHSDSSIGSTKFVDRVSLTIKQRIEEVTTSDSEEEFEPHGNEDADYFRSNSAFTNDEPNWFLQRRQFRGGTNSPVPVPMLVPDPTVETKVLIGDKEIDDTSDLSDVPSDFEEENDKDSSLDVKSHLIGSKTLIGGKNLLADLSFIQQSDDEVSADSGVKECKDLDEVDSEVFSTSTKMKDEVAIDESLSSECSQTERDTEYTERYGTLPRTILIPKNNKRLPENDNNKKQSGKDITETKVSKEEGDDENRFEFAGVYSQREKEKWRNAVELENNPYSKENIERRIKSRNSVNSLFGSDYYIRQACLPSGAKRTEAEKVSPSAPKEVSGTSEKFKQRIDEFPPEEDTVFLATPIHLDESSNILQNTDSFENTIDIVDPEINFSSEITSDSDVSLVNCYDVKESVIYKKQSAEDEEIQTAEKFFDFESIETNLNSIELKEEQYQKPVAKPRKKVATPQTKETKSETVELDMMRFKPKEAHEDNFNAKPYIINKRSDNTLIKKIYSDPSVRSFALNSRHKLPISDKQVLTGAAPQNSRISGKRKVPFEDNKKHINTSTQDDNSRTYKKEPPQLLSQTVSKIENTKCEENPEKELNDIDCFYARAFAWHTNIARNFYESTKEIDELKEQKLVASRLKELSKSTTSLSRISNGTLGKAYSDGIERHRKLSVTSVSDDNSDFVSGLMNGGRSTSVKDLRKKFEMYDAKAKADKPILYSLTGRSISKQLKDRLKDLNMQSSPQLTQVYSLSTTDLEVEENTRKVD